MDLATVFVSTIFWVMPKIQAALDIFRKEHADDIEVLRQLLSLEACLVDGIFIGNKELEERTGSKTCCYHRGSVTLNLEDSDKWETALLCWRCSCHTQKHHLHVLRSIVDNRMTCSTIFFPKGGFGIKSGSYKTLIQPVLFAHTMHDSALRCLRFVVPKIFLGFNESGLLIRKAKSRSPNIVSTCKDVHSLADTDSENHSAPNSADHGSAKGEDQTDLLRLANPAKAEDKTEVTWLMATAALHHATGVRDLLSGFETIKDLFVKAGDGVSMPVCGRGSVITDTVVLLDVWFVPGLTENLVSVTQLTELDYSVGFSRGACIIKSATDGVLIGKAHVLEDGLFEVDFLKVRPVI